MAKKKGSATVVSDDAVKQSVAGENLIKIDERAVLVYLSLGQWTSSKLDKEVTQDVVERLGATPGSFRATKDLLPNNEPLERLIANRRAFRKYHYEVTTAYGRDGWALLKTTKIPDYKRKYADAIAEDKILLRAFLDQYDDAVEKAKLPAPQGLGNGWKQTDYPPKSVVESKFRFTSDMRRIRESQNALIGVSDEVTAQIAKEADERVRAGLEVSVRSIIERITKVVGAVAEVESKGKIYDSLIENVRDLAVALPDLNVTGDSRYDKIADEMMAKLGKFTKDDLTGSDDAAKAARKEAATSAKEILDDLAGAF